MRFLKPGSRVLAIVLLSFALLASGCAATNGLFGSGSGSTGSS